MLEFVWARRDAAGAEPAFPFPALYACLVPHGGHAGEPFRGAGGALHDLDVPKLSSGGRPHPNRVPGVRPSASLM